MKKKQKHWRLIKNIKDGFIITAATNGILFSLKATSIKPPNTSLHSMEFMKRAGRICGGVLVKNYAVMHQSLHVMDQWVHSCLVPWDEKQNFVA